MRINENIPALNAYASISRMNLKTDTAMRRLSSGIRINSVKDDSAGMAISNKLKDQINGLDKAGRNSMDGISAIQTAEGALQEVQNMLQRMRELAIQASNATYEPEDRAKMQEEIDQLKLEITEISERTEFNKIKLLNGDARRLGISSVNMTGVAKCTYISETVPKDELSYTVDKVGMPAVAATIPSAIGAVSEGMLEINGERISFSSSDTPDQAIEKFKELCDRTNVDVLITNNDTWDDIKSGTADMILYTRDQGSDQFLNISGDASVLAMFGLTGGSQQGTDAQISGVSLPGNVLSSTIDGNKIELRGAGGQIIELEIQLGEPLPSGQFALKNGDSVASDGTVAPAGGYNATVELSDYGMMILQVGPNKAMEMKFQIPEVTAHGLGLDNFSVASFNLAQEAVVIADDALSKVSSVRAKLGAYQNRLEHTYESLTATSENTRTARSRIYDTDMAWEMTEMTRFNIISQAGISILAQANQRPQQILQLIQ